MITADILFTLENYAHGAVFSKEEPVWSGLRDLKTYMDSHPVAMVSWYGAKAFCDYYGYRLPTEAEWECAARSGNLYYQYPWGTNTIDSSKCNYDKNNPMGLSSYPYTTPVGHYSSPTGF